MAEAAKSPEVTKTFAAAGSPVAYLDAPKFSKFVAEVRGGRFRAPDRGGEDDRQGGVGLLLGPAAADPAVPHRMRQMPLLYELLHSSNDVCEATIKRHGILVAKVSASSLRIVVEP